MSKKWKLHILLFRCYNLYDIELIIIQISNLALLIISPCSYDYTFCLIEFNVFNKCSFASYAKICFTKNLYWYLLSTSMEEFKYLVQMGSTFLPKAKKRNADIYLLYKNVFMIIVPIFQLPTMTPNSEILYCADSCTSKVVWLLCSNYWCKKIET